MVELSFDRRTGPQLCLERALESLPPPEPGRFLRVVPNLIVEVLSALTATRDRGEKRGIYERNGVREYILVDWRARTLSAHVSESGRFVERSAGVDTWESVVLPGLTFRASETDPVSSTPNEGFGRPSGQDEVHRFAALMADGFGMNPADVPAVLANAGKENIRLEREHGEIASGLMLVHQGQFWGGRSVKMGGVAGVATAPHLRGKGAATQLMRNTLRELRSLGYPLAGLYASTQRLYRRVGFEQAGVRAELRGSIRELPSGDRDLPVRTLRPGDEDAVEALYSEIARTRNGWLDRGSYVWNRVTNPRGTTTNAYLFGHGSELEGYVFLGKARPASAGSLYELKISDLQFRTERAARRILTFLADDGSMASEFSWYSAPDHPLQLLLPEQSIRVRVENVWMLRILDVPGAMQARGWPKGLRGELHLELEDELFAENAGRWMLEISGGEARVRRGGEGQLRCHVRALASLYSAHRTASELASVGFVTGTDDAVEAADALFAARAPSMPDMF